MAPAALTIDRVLHYLPRQVKFNRHVIDIKRLFQRNKLLYYLIILKGVLSSNTWASQQHKYLKHGGHEPVISKKMTLGKVVLDFTRQGVSSKILRIFR